MTFAPCSSKLITAAILNEKNKKRNEKERKPETKETTYLLFFYVL